jgi:hypothetical protein
MHNVEVMSMAHLQFRCEMYTIHYSLEKKLTWSGNFPPFREPDCFLQNEIQIRRSEAV